MRPSAVPPPAPPPGSCILHVRRPPCRAGAAPRGGQVRPFLLKVGSCSLQAAWGARRRPREQRRSARGEAGLRATATGVRGDGAARAARRAGVCGVLRNLRGHPLIPPSPRQHVATWGHPHLHPPGYKYPGVQPPPSRNPAARKQWGVVHAHPGCADNHSLHPPGV